MIQSPDKIPTIDLSKTSSESPTQGIPTKTPQWVKLYQSLFLELLEKNSNGDKFTLRMFRVYLLLICRMEYGNYVNESQHHLASSIGMTPQAFSDALKKLEELRYLGRIGGKGSSRKIMLNPTFIWIGSDLWKKAKSQEFDQRFPKKVGEGNKGQTEEVANGNECQSVEAADQLPPDPNEEHRGEPNRGPRVSLRSLHKQQSIRSQLPEGPHSIPQD